VLVGRPARRQGLAGIAGSTELRHTSPAVGVDPLGSSIPVRRSRRVRRTGGGSLAPLSPPIPATADGTAAGTLTIPLLPGERTIGRRIRFGAVSACTLSSLVLGVAAIFISVNHGDIRLAALCLLACVVFDGLDGALARRLGVASPFGAQMDSLADMCSFGIAAPVVVYTWLSGSAPAVVLVPACVLVAVCAAIRLARFNVSPKHGRFFCGVPTTMTAAVLALATIAAPASPALAKVAVVVLLALAMVSSFPYLKLARLLRLPPWLLAAPVIGAFIDYRLTFAAAVSAYLASGPVLWLRQRQRGKRPVRQTSGR
jgi:CDP-diacylglycerol--serine O-phosphatidyltransferase